MSSGKSIQRRGIEAIVGAVLLIVITVVAAVLLYLWFTGYLTGTASKVPQINTVQQFIVTGASITSSTGAVTAYVENTGNVPVTIVQANVLDPQTGRVVCSAAVGGTGNGAPSSPASLPSTIVSSSGAVGTVSFTCSKGFSSGQSYTIQLISNNGVSAEYTTTAS
ncbi:MAG: archaellin/type IV pilin N-terminal domain-containing protein [Thermocladium sp.]